MSLFKSISVLDEFYGVTTTKGDIIVNDGIKNNKLSTGSDTYVLTADSTTLTGLKWAIPTSTGTNNINYEHKILSNVISTNSVIPITISEFNFTPTIGNYIILINLAYRLSKVTNRTAIFGIYKNNVLVFAKNVSSFNSTSNMLFYSQYILNFNGTDTLSIKFNTNNLDSTCSVTSGDLILLDISNFAEYSSSIPFSTNATVPVEILDMTNTPSAGIHMILFNGLQNVSKNDRCLTIGLYKNNTLITGARRILDILPGKSITSQLITVETFSGSDVLKVKVNSSNTDNDINILERSLVLVKLS